MINLYTFSYHVILLCIYGIHISEPKLRSMHYWSLIIPWYSKCSPWTSSVSITSELVRTAESLVQLQDIINQNLYFNKILMWHQSFRSANITPIMITVVNKRKILWLPKCEVYIIGKVSINFIFILLPVLSM